MTEYQQIGRYKVESSLGEGAMGTVLRAHDPKINRHVAIKMVKFDKAVDEELVEEFRERFVREAQISGRLNHPNVVQVYDVGEQDGMPYIAMEYVEGQTLSQFLNRTPRPSHGELLQILYQIAIALDHAHEKDIVHRDLKPGNVMVQIDATAKIMDFGIAKLNDSTLTQTGIFLGTPSYSSPEQVKDGTVTSVSDIFSFGTLAHETLSGHLPFPGNNINTILYKIANDGHKVAPNLKELPVNTEAWLNTFFKVFEKKPEARYQKAVDFINDLAGAFVLSQGEQQALQPYRMTDLDKTVRDPNMQKSLLQQDLKRSAYEGGYDPTIATKPPPQIKKKSKLVPVMAVLVFMVGGGYAAWHFGLLDDVKPYFNQIVPEDEVVTVSDDDITPTPPVENDTVEDAIQPAVAEKSFVIDSSPQGADIRVGGAVVGQTPHTYLWREAESESITLELALEGHQGVSETLVFSDPTKERYQYTLDVLPVKRDISSTPAAAQLTIDGKIIGPTPQSFEFVPQKAYKLKLTKRGYYAKSFTYKEGETPTSRLKAALKEVPPPGSLEVVTTMDDLKITVKGRTTKGSELKLEAGTYAVTLSSDAYFYKQVIEDVQIKSGAATALETPVILTIPKIDFIGAYVKVRINGQYVKNGGEVDTTPLVNLRIAAGSHVFEFIDEDDKIVAQKTFEVLKSEPIIETLDSAPDR